MILFRIGNDDRPAGPQDIKDFQKHLRKALRKGKSMVSHHAVDFLIVPDDELRKSDFKVGKKK